MKADTIEQVRRGRVWLTADECDLDDFAALVERTTDPADYPFAEEVISNVLVYDGAAVREAATSPDTRRALLAEWVEAMTGGPGIVVFRNAFDDTAEEALVSDVLAATTFGVARSFADPRRAMIGARLHFGR